MNIDNIQSDIMSLTNQMQSGIGTVTKAGADLGLTALRSDRAPWMSRLQVASFRGVPFEVQIGDSSFGRRNVVHEYPYRDTVWVEDLGRSARRLDIQGFLVGDDCIAQRDAMIAACERKDDGDSKLVHPTYGEMNVTLLGRLKVTERWDRGRMFEIYFSFIESGKRLFPSAGQPTGSAVTDAASAADSASASSFSRTIAGALKVGASAVQRAVNVTKAWTSTAQRITNDATNLVNLVSTIGGQVGRFANGRNVGGLNSNTSLAANSSVSVSGLVARGSAARAAVSSLVTSATAGAGNLSSSTTSSFATIAQSLVQAVAASASEPADAVRLMTNLSESSTTVADSGAAQQSALVATDDLLRRAAVVQMARVSLAYQPASVDDAAALRTTLCAKLDEEITVAGDQGADDVYNALRALRTVVAADLAARGAGLPTTMTVGSSLPLPALALAQRLYRNSSRADELVTQSNCVHPAFMPTSFKALSK
jgi:prophage DNA circulation protein